MNRRPRRLRLNAQIRKLVQENTLEVSDFLVPIFIVEGKNKKEEISSMPNYYRFSLDTLSQELDELLNLGLYNILLFTKIENNLKDNKGTEALNSDGLMQRAISLIKKYDSRFQVFTDVALDPFSSLGHDGIIKDGKIENDATVEILSQMALSHAQAGADFVAPSDMMDGRVKAIRKCLDKNGFKDVGILAYSAKYASSFYGPFRDALQSAPVDNENVPKDKKTYQMDFHNSKEALVETYLDIKEGADIVMVKPGMPYLDIVKLLSDSIEIPIAVYQVSGEYSMIYAAAQNHWIDLDKAIYESLIAFKRAGAKIIATYFAKEAAKILVKNKNYLE